MFKPVIDIIETILSNIDDCTNKQRNLHKPSPKNPKRDEFWKDYDKYGFEYVLKKYVKNNYIGRLKNIIKNILLKAGVLEKVRRILNKTSR